MYRKYMQAISKPVPEQRKVKPRPFQMISYAICS